MEGKAEGRIKILTDTVDRKTKQKQKNNSSMSFGLGVIS